MGIFDTHKTWNFSVSAKPEQCFQAFSQAMTQPGFKFVGSKWHLERGQTTSPSGDPAWPAIIATYLGRGGVIGGLTMLSFGRVGDIAQNEEEKAKGSQITFAINPENAGSKTECSLWLSKFNSSFGFTADGRFLLIAMHDVEKHLRVLDPMLTVNKVS